MTYTLFVAAKLLTTTLGLLIAYQAYRGYQRHGTPLMLYVALGFVLIALGSLLEGALYELARLSMFESGTVAALVAASGMLSILYALYAPGAD